MSTIRGIVRPIDPMGVTHGHTGTDSHAPREVRDCRRKRGRIAQRQPSMNINPDLSQQDEVVLLDAVPGPACEPFLVASERRIALSYRIADADFERFGPFDDDAEPYCMILFTGTDFHRLGPPGDDALDMHPLASRGLQSYSAHEVVNSSLVAEGWDVASPQASLRHFVFTFMDATFECVAVDYTVAGVFGSGDIAAREAFALVR